MTRLYQHTITVPYQNADVRSDQYLDLGAISVTSENTSHTETTLTILATPKSWFKRAGILGTPSLLKASDWKYKSHEHRASIEIVPGIHIVNATHQYHDIAPPHGTSIYIDPKDAFGDGYHPTTRLCADAMCQILANVSITSAIDIGCGTGVLAILAKKRGVATVTATDIDAKAIRKTRRNAKLNKVDIHTEIANITTWTPHSHYDLVIANLHTSIVETVFTKLLTIVSLGGYLILSGVSAQWKTDIQSRIERELGHTEITINESDGWCSFTVQR